MSPRLHKYIVIFIITAVSFCFQFKTLNQFPQYIHSWAQCDRYALALGFINNGEDLFHPQTYVMNNQFPGEFMIPRTTTITSVDFPIHDYVVSFIMRVAHSTEPWYFRLYILLYSIIGLYFLYKLVALFTPSLTRALFVVLFALSSPVFLYYQAGFLPTIPSLANGFIGLYFFFSFLKNHKRKFFYLALLFITLAAMARLPFAIVLVAMMCFEFCYSVKKKRLELFKVIAFIVCIACIASYYKYNDYLREQYGSLFLNYIIPASSWHDLVDFTKTALQKWRFAYFSPLAYVLLLIVAVVPIFGILRRKIILANPEKQFLFLICIMLGGCGLYYLLMTYQFMNHDYYFLDTFYIPLIGLILFFVVKWPVINFFPKMKNTEMLSILVFIPVFIMSKQNLDERIRYFNTGEPSTAENYKGSAQWLDSLGVPATARLLVFGSDGSNNAFVLLRRKGFVIIEPTKEKIETALKWPFDYVVVDNENMISKVYSPSPEIIQELVKVADNGRISLYKRSAKAKDIITEEAFFQLDKKPVVFHDQENLDINKTEQEKLEKLGITGVKLMSNLDSVTEYGYTFKLKNNPVLKGKNRLLKVTCHLENHQLLKDLLMCVSLQANGKDLLFEAKDMGVKSSNSGWQNYTFLYALPAVPEGQSELGVFIWNRGKNSVSYDDFQLTIY